MSKKQITVDVDEFAPGDLDYSTLDEVIARFTKLKECYGGDARLCWEREFYYPYDSKPTSRYTVQQHRLETDDEYRLRLDDEQQRAAARAAADAAEWQRLQAIYGNKK